MEETLKDKLIKYYKSLGIEVCTNTNANGHQGYFSGNKIEISKKIKKEKIIPTLLHEFSHFIHAKIEKNILDKGGTINVLFNLSELEKGLDLFSKTLQEELWQVTNFVDKNSLCHILTSCIIKIDKEIKNLECQIKKDYPHFMKSKNFEEFYAFEKENKLVECNIPAFAAYIKLKCAQKEKKRICRNINKFKKYYQTPTELFARFVEGLYLDSEAVCKIANKTYHRFFELLESGYYGELKNVFHICKSDIKTNANPF